VNSSKIILVSLFLWLAGAPFARCLTIQYDFTGVFYQSSFQNAVKVGDTFTASLQIDYSAPLISVSGDNNGHTYALFHHGIPSFSMTINGVTMVTDYASDTHVYWNTADRLMLWSRSFGYPHNVWAEGGHLYDWVLFVYPNGGTAVPANFGVYGDLVPIAPPSAFSFSVNSYVVATGVTLNAYAVVTAATMKDISSPASVPDFIPSGLMFAGVLASLLAVKDKGRSRVA
jgi:hypothetical protein